MTASTSWGAGVLRLPAAADLAATLRRLEQGYAGWLEELPYAAADELADQYRERWLLRAPATGRPVRTGLARYADGTAELLFAGWLRSPEQLEEFAHRMLSGERWLTVAPAPADPPGRPVRLSVRLPGPDRSAHAGELLAAAIRRRADSGVQLPRWRYLGPSGLAGRLIQRCCHPAADTLHFTLDQAPGGPGLLSCDAPAGRYGTGLLAALLGEVAGELTAAPAVPLPARGTHRIDELVLQAAASRPHDVAVSYPGGQLDYAELVRRARAISHLLQQAGVRRGDRVGVELDRGEDLVPSLLGVLLAGAAYVPLDPSYPADRLDYIRQDAGVAALIAAAGTGGAIDPAAARSASAELGAEVAGRSIRDAAYIIYTSGSTGRPKGVVVEHQNFASLLAATRSDYGFGRNDVWTMFHSYAFDFSVWEIWGCLGTGGRLVLVPVAVATAPADFRRLLHEEGVTVCNQTPSAFSQLLTTERPDADELYLRLVIFGGEKLDSRLLVRWFDRHPERHCRMVNMYGITETTVHSSWFEVRRNDALAASDSVGVALPGWQLYVLDEAGQPVPPGGFGEIYVGGHGVARGYHDRPGLTAQRFLPDHLSGRPGGRLYRSGDRGRLRPDGQIEHHGRLDNQVKVRGYRIELDEIRNAMLAVEGVTAAAVLLRHRGEDADAHLDAYLVGAEVDTGRLRRELANRLPAYMLPSTITKLDRLPMTSNGKLDRDRLPSPSGAVEAEPPAAEPGGGRSENGRTGTGRSGTGRTGGAGPAAELGDRLMEIWHRVLGVPVAPDDNFFLVGGNSLLAIRLLTRLREAGLDGAGSVRVIYENPTIEQLARALAC